jgi:hypothetical protein
MPFYRGRLRSLFYCIFGLQTKAFHVRIEVFTAVTMKNAVFWDVAPCGCCKNRHQLLVTSNIVSSSPLLVTLMMEAIRSSETSILTTATWRNIPGDGIL